MPNLNYQRGRNREYKVRDELSETYDLVVRTAGSHSPVDVIALSDFFVDPQYGLCAKVKLVQVKTSKGAKSIKKEMGLSIEGENGSIIIEKWTYPTKDHAKGNRKESKTNVARHLPKSGGKVPTRRRVSKAQ